MSQKRNRTLTVVLLALSACLICAMSDGIKNNYGIMLSTIIENSGMSYSSVSLVLAVGQLFYGMMLPVFGMLARKKGSTLTLLLGIGMMLAGLLLLPYCRSPWSLMLCLGLLLPSGTGAASYGILIGSITPRIPQSTVSLVSGVVNASSGVGNAVLSPVIQMLLEKGGISAAMLVLSVPTALMIPLCIFVGRGSRTAAVREQDSGTAPATGTELFRAAFRSRTYRLLMAGFFTCGFHMALISNHLPSQIISYGISAQISSYAFSVYGFMIMAGSVLSGAVCGKVRRRTVLGTYYALRAVITPIFLVMPKTIPAVFCYAVLLGLTGAATVPPVSDLIGLEFGAESVGTLYGFVFFIHSIGGFLGAWLGGLFVDAFGGYVQIWITDVVLCIIAAAASYLIRAEEQGTGKPEKNVLS